MSLHHELQQTQTQQASPAMLQSLKVLQLSAPELEQWVDREIAQNPLLERVSDSPSETPQDYTYTDGSSPKDHTASSGTDSQAYLAAIAQPPSFQELLQEQLTDVDGEVREYLELLIENLDDDGFLSPETLQSLGFHPANHLESKTQTPFVSDNPVHQEAYEILRTLHPRGLGAVDLKDCLRLQLPKTHPLIRLLNEAYEDVLHHRFARLQRKYRCTPETLRNWLAPLRKLIFSPKKSLSNEASQLITPEIIFSQNSDDPWTATVAGAPHIRLRSASDVERPALSNDLKQARWLMRALTRRQQTLEAIAQYILNYQRDFLEHGIAALHPQSIKQVAEILRLSPSTLSRAAQEKYVQVQHQIIPLKKFFTHGNGNSLAPSPIVCEAIQKLIIQESSLHPLTDEDIVKNLQKKGIAVARRTVSKYRQQLGIPTSHVRRIFPQATR
ncbi:MAG: RNA polymerase factor sigma-54 [Verrucomicrobiota bacterium]|nr:MAG: RNA polymerase factor sigma-54 [Verrucomicrobiota bacterium]